MPVEADAAVKVCAMCRESKPVGDFYVVKAEGRHARDRFFSYCKPCSSARSARYGNSDARGPLPIAPGSADIKVCSTCYTAKPVEDFQVIAPSGRWVSPRLFSRCKSCVARRTEEEKAHADA